jgi:hypothetical protein
MGKTEIETQTETETINPRQDNHVERASLKEKDHA